MRYFFDPVIARYIRERLQEECKAWGAESEIARATGVAQGYVSLLSKGQRNVGPEFAAALCRYWGMKQSDLRRIAHQTYNSNALIDSAPRPHPNLDATLEFYGAIYPKPFLEQFEVTARREADRSRLDWVFEMQNRFRMWLTTQLPSIQRKHMHLLALPVPSTGAVPAPPKKGSRK